MADKMLTKIFKRGNFMMPGNGKRAKAKPGDKVTMSAANFAICSHCFDDDEMAVEVEKVEAVEKTEPKKPAKKPTSKFKL